MKSLVAAMGALALATSVAQAAPTYKQAPRDEAAGQTLVVAGWNARHSGPTRDRATNHGAGTSRSNDANQG